MFLKKFALILFWLLVMNLFGFFMMDAFAINEPADSLRSALAKATGNAKIEILHALTRELWSTYPEESMKYAGMAYDVSLADHDSANMAMAIKNTGIIFYFTGENKNALTCYNKALKIYTSLSDKKGISSCVNNMGIIYKDLGDYDKALTYYQKSAETDYQLHDEEALASTLSNIGEIYHLQGLYDDAVAYYKKSLQLEIKYKNFDGVGECLLNIGAAYQENGMNTESMKNYDYALAIFMETGNSNRLALTCHNIGQLYYSMNDYFKSYLYACKAMGLWNELDHKQGKAATANLLAIIYEATGHEEKANEYFFKAITLDLELGNKKKTAIVLSDKGQMLMKDEEYEQAIAFFLNSLELARDIDAWPELLDDYQFLSEAYYKLKDTVHGLYYDDLYKILADSMKNEATEFARTNIQNSDTSKTRNITEKPGNNYNPGISKTVYYIIFSAVFVIFLIVFIFLLTQKRGRNT